MNRNQHEESRKSPQEVLGIFDKIIRFAFTHFETGSAIGNHVKETGGFITKQKSIHNRTEIQFIIFRMIAQIWIYPLSLQYLNHSNKSLAL